MHPAYAILACIEVFYYFELVPNMMYAGVIEVILALTHRFYHLRPWRYLLLGKASLYAFGEKFSVSCKACFLIKVYLICLLFFGFMTRQQVTYPVAPSSIKYSLGDEWIPVAITSEIKWLPPILFIVVIGFLICENSFRPRLIAEISPELFT